MADALTFAAVAAGGTMLTLLAILLALRGLSPRPDLTWAWGAWFVTLGLLLILFLAGLRDPPFPGPEAMPAPTPPAGA